MAPSEDDLEVNDARADKAARRRLALLLVVTLAPSLLYLSGGARDSSLLLLAMGSFAIGITAAWRAGMIERAHAMLKIGTIRRAGLAATELLNQGDVAGAQRGFVALLKSARPLGAYHATHVLMYGVTRFFEGETSEGLRLATRALDSGWFSSPKARGLRDASETWRVLMLLEQGETAEARKRLDALPEAKLTAARLLLEIAEGEWQTALDAAKEALADKEAPKTGRPTIAALGRYAARKLAREDEVAAFEAVLEVEPLTALAKANPALRGRFD